MWGDQRIQVWKFLTRFADTRYFLVKQGIPAPFGSQRRSADSGRFLFITDE